MTTDKSRADALTATQRDAISFAITWLNQSTLPATPYGDYVVALRELLAASPVEQHEPPAADERAAFEKLAAKIHYPECWDTAAYPTLAAALVECSAWYDMRCGECEYGSAARAPSPNAAGAEGAEIPAGYALVPIAPTDALLRSFYECPSEELETAWSAMLWIAGSILRRNQSQSAPPPPAPASAPVGLTIEHIEKRIEDAIYRHIPPKAALENAKALMAMGHALLEGAKR
ncbi:hypothetical protein AAB988_29645 [Burkholderia contaminans]|uniref:hypothetical protein n=1 Tax=Burkholderia contaminans TaxID=488447 RepID=UPI00310D6C5D